MELTGVTDKNILITGASGSIGSKTAEVLARMGANLSLTGRNQDKLNKTAEACKAAGAKKVHIIIADVTNLDDVKNMVESTIKELGSIDILINSAAIIRPGLFITTPLATYDDIYQTNLRGFFALLKLAVPHLISSKGRILNVSSYLGNRPSYLNFSFGLYQAVLDQFMRALALEIGPQGVRVNAVSPGLVSDSDFYTKPGAPLAKTKPEQVAKMREAYKQMYPLRRLAEIKDVTSAIAFMCSDQSQFMHGVVMPVDGGKVLTSKAAVDDKPQH